MSAVITLVIVVMWAVVLVPMWLRRHDRTSELTSVDRFAGAMKVLSRRSGGTDRRWVVMPARAERSRRPEVSGGMPARRPAAGAPARRPAAGAVGRQVLRRRRTLGVLTAAVVLTGLLAVLAGGQFTLLQVLCDLLLAAGLVRTRMMVADERRRREAHLARAQRQLALGRAAGAGDQRRAPERVRRAPAAEAPFVEAPYVEAPYVEAPYVEAPVAAASAGGASAPGGRSREDVPVRVSAAVQPSASVRPSAPRPAFTGPSRPVRISSDPATPDGLAAAAVAGPLAAGLVGSVVSVVDLTRPGAWTEGRLLEDTAVELNADDDELSGILERRRAVNG